MENMGIVKLTQEIQKLNPTVCLVYDTYNCPGIIYCSREPETLKYPQGYYYSNKNVVTNKHCTANGIYETFEICKDTTIAYRD